MAKDKIIFVNFTKLNCQELEMIYKWRTSDSISKYMETSADFTLDSHLKFCESLKQCEDKRYYLVKLNDVPFGVFDFVKIDLEKKNAEVGIYTIEEYRKFTPLISYYQLFIGLKLGLKSTNFYVKKDNIKAVLYNTVKLKHKIKSEDEQNYYFDVPYSSLNEYQQDPHFYDYECEVID